MVGGRGVPGREKILCKGKEGRESTGRNESKLEQSGFEEGMLFHPNGSCVFLEQELSVALRSPHCLLADGLGSLCGAQSHLFPSGDCSLGLCTGTGFDKSIGNWPGSLMKGHPDSRTGSCTKHTFTNTVHSLLMSCEKAAW